jgi:SAM-dependent methyltransferase
LNYPISKVVGGFGRDITPEETIPHVLARTYIEHNFLRGIMHNYVLGPNTGSRWSMTGLEVGCGYGRMMPLMNEFSTTNLDAYERDPKLAAIASSLMPHANVHVGTTLCAVDLPKNHYDIILTFTVLQHMDAEVMMDTVEEMKKLRKKGGTIILVEETDKIQAQDLWGRAVSMYQLMMEPELKLIHSEIRYLEPGNPYKTGGHYMVFR